MLFKNKENHAFINQNLISHGSQDNDYYNSKVKTLTKHPSNKRFSLGAELNTQAFGALRPKDLNLTNYECRETFEPMPDALLEISEEDERRFPEQLTQNPTQTEEYQKRNSRCSNSNEIAPIVEIIKPAINKEKSEHYQEVKQRFSNVNESPSFQVSKEKSKDPLDRYRTPNVSKHISQPKEIIEDHKLRKKIMSFAIFIVFVLIVMNLIFLNGSNSTNLVDKEKNKTEIQNSEKKTTINEISESSSHITDGYNRLGYQIYQRLKIEVTVHKTISLNKLEADLSERYGDSLREIIWPIVTSYRKEENEIIETIDFETEEKIWTVKTENL